jgi:histone H3/H4
LEGNVSDLPNAVVKRLLSKHGDGMRVSGDAIDKAVAAAEDYIARLAREAHALAVADKRKTIMESDIVQARARVS